LAALALGLRLAAVVVLWPTGPVPTFEHGEIARRLLAGEGFSVTFLGQTGPTSQQAPFVPLLLAGCYALLGVDRPAAVALFAVLQCLAGTAAVLGVVVLGKRWVPGHPAVAWVAGAAAALYPPHVYMVTHVQVATWATLVLVALLAITAGECAVYRRRSAWLVGGLAGVALWIEPIFALAVPVVMLALGLAARRAALDENVARPMTDVLARRAAWRTFCTAPPPAT
jgi:hypothetical protein